VHKYISADYAYFQIILTSFSVPYLIKVKLCLLLLFRFYQIGTVTGENIEGKIYRGWIFTLRRTYDPLSFCKHLIEFHYYSKDTLNGSERTFLLFVMVWNVC
jgi:hypothetical protein